MATVVWTRTALRGVARAHDYVFDFNPLAASRLAEALLNAADSLGDFPHRGRLVVGKAMRELMTAYPYIIRYKIAGEAVVILRVRHTSRRPT